MNRRWAKRRTLIGLAIVGAVLMTIGGTGAAACKLLLNCGIGHPQRYDEGYLKGLDEGPPTRLPPGFTNEVVAGGLTFPTDLTFLPDGRMLVAEKDGLIRVVKDGHLLATPFIDISNRVDTDGYRGLIAVQADPAFATNGYVYLLYTRQPSGPAHGPTTDRLVRVTAQGDTALPASERVVLGKLGNGSCLSLPPGSDCIPADHEHVGGDIAFAKDGTMFVSTGDGGGGPDAVEPTVLRAQDVDFLSGKILHLTRDGKGVPSNPFWNGDADAIRSKVWAYGLRNPFRLALGPGGTPYVGNVGEETFEEIDVATRGANLGWPCYEGRAHEVEFAGTPLCGSLYAKDASALKWPALVYRHGTPTGGQSVTGGGFYTGASFPPIYRGAYFYGDWERSWLRILRFDSAGRLVGGPENFATGASGPVSISEGPDGALYYLAFYAKELRRITYKSS